MFGHLMFHFVFCLSALKISKCVCTCVTACVYVYMCVCLCVLDNPEDVVLHAVTEVTTNTSNRSIIYDIIHTHTVT